MSSSVDCTWLTKRISYPEDTSLWTSETEMHREKRMKKIIINENPRTAVEIFHNVCT